MKKQFVFQTCLTVLLLAGPWLAGPALADSDWNIQTVDSTGDVGCHGTSLALDAGGNAHISYCDVTNANLKYAAWNGSSWNIETVDSEGSVGFHSSLALDSSGYPHISYNAHYSSPPYTLNNLKYAAWNSSTSSWDIETVKSGSQSIYPSLALDSSDVPHIAYYRSWPYGNDLMYTYWNGSSWIDQVVDYRWMGIVGLSLALDSSDNPHISYHDWDNHRLKYAVWNGSSWSSTFLDTTTSVSGTSYDTSLVLDSSGYPHISYFGGTTPHLKYVAWDGSDWHIETVDDATKVNKYTALALDGSGFAHIVYYDDTNQDLKYAAWDGSGWAIETVDSTGDVGWFPSIALDASGNAHISYYDATNGDLKYAIPEPPCWQEQAKLLASDGFGGACFGMSVSISGDYAIAGASWGNGNVGHSGSAYIFKHSDIPDDPNWYQQVELIASDGAYYDYFGDTVSISGDYAIVGATFDDDKGHQSGSAYIFKRDGTTWSQQAKLLASDGAAGDRFGQSVSINGGYAVVGAFCDDDNGADSGSAYIFNRSDIPDDPNWYQQAKLLASDGAAGDYFGLSVCISGDYAIVGGAYANDDNGSDSGSAYMFKRSDIPDDPNWYQQAKLTASDGAAGDLFGRVVSISADYCIVGAYCDDDNGTSSGSAYIFKRSALPDDPNWYQQAKIITSDGAAGDGFGLGVSISSNYAIVGATGDDDSGLSSGSAYIFKRSGTSWIQVDKLTASDGISRDLFGLSVSISGDYCLAGAYHHYPSPYPGSAYIFKNICNEAPVANAGDNTQIASAEQGTTVIQGTATDPDADPLEYRWLEANQVLLEWSPVDSNGRAYLHLGTLPFFSIGNHTLTLEAREVGEGGLSASDDMVLTIDNSPPEAQAAPNYQVVEIGIDPIIVVADVADFDGDQLAYEWLKDGVVLDSGTVETVHGGNTVPIPDLFVPAGDPCFPVGVHSIELRVSDGINDDVNDFVSVEVSDTCAPSLSPVPSVTFLWPPNHKLRPVTIAANAFDNGGGAIVLDVTVQSSEPPDADGDGSTIPDYYIDSVDDETGIIELRLRAERSGKGDGRTYTITITATDATGNQSVAIVEILAPHDKRKK